SRGAESLRWSAGRAERRGSSGRRAQGRPRRYAHPQQQRTDSVPGPGSARRRPEERTAADVMAPDSPETDRSARRNIGVVKSPDSVSADSIDQAPNKSGQEQAAPNGAEDTAHAASRIGRGGLGPTFSRVSWTNRRSWFEQAFRDAGFDPDVV